MAFAFVCVFTYWVARSNGHAALNLAHLPHQATWPDTRSFSLSLPPLLCFDSLQQQTTSSGEVGVLSPSSLLQTDTENNILRLLFTAVCQYKPQQPSDCELAAQPVWLQYILQQQLSAELLVWRQTELS